MHATLPTPQDIGLKIPPDLVVSRFNAGFEHGLKGGHLTSIEYFRRSFRMGFRSAKLFLREVRRRRGIVEFPLCGRVKLRTIWG